MSTIRTLVEKNKAGYPALYLVSPEDDRSLGDIQRAADIVGRKLYVWTFQKGISSKNGSKTSTISDSSNPDDALKVAGQLEQNSILVLRHFHHFVEAPTIQAMLLDLLPTYKRSRRQVIILSPVMKLPPEIEKEFSVVNIDLPNKEELRTVFDSIASGLAKPSEEVTEKLIEAAMGLTTTEAENAFSLAAIRPNLNEKFQKKDGVHIWDPAVVMNEKCETAKKTGVLSYYPPTGTGLSTIGGLDLYKSWVSKRSKAWGEEAAKFGLPVPKGVIMLGVPGTGKSLSAKATAEAFGLPLIRVDMGAIYGGLVGSSESNARMVIQFIEAVAPAVLWMDEIEKGFAGANSGQLDSGVGARVLGTFLTWMQEKTKPVFVVATANNVSILPPELLRKGRFDEMFYVALPNLKERKEIFRIHISKMGRGKLIESGKIDLDDLAKVTDGYSGAEIEAIIREALFDAFSVGKDLNMFDLSEAISNVLPLKQMMKEQIAWLEEWQKGRCRPANAPEEIQMASGRSLQV